MAARKGGKVANEARMPRACSGPCAFEIIYHSGQEYNPRSDSCVNIKRALYLRPESYWYTCAGQLCDKKVRTAECEEKARETKCHRNKKEKAKTTRIESNRIESNRIESQPGGTYSSGYSDTGVRSTMREELRRVECEKKLRETKCHPINRKKTEKTNRIESNHKPETLNTHCTTVGHRGELEAARNETGPTSKRKLARSCRRQLGGDRLPCTGLAIDM